MKYRFVAAGFLLMLSNPALGETTTWTCTYPSFVAGLKPVIQRYRVVGTDVVDENGLRYRILENNDYGLIAASAASESRSPYRGTGISAFVLLIDKGTNEMKFDIVVMGDKNPVLPRSGTCLPS
jgi:hypothetical protein